jgi:hypothetical protein
MIITKVLKYKIFEYCIDNFFEVLSKNLGIYEDNMPFMVIVKRATTTDKEDWVPPAIFVRITGRGFVDIEEAISLETIQDSLAIFGKDRLIDEIIKSVMRSHIEELKNSVGETILIAILIELKRQLNTLLRAKG